MHVLTKMTLGVSVGLIAASAAVASPRNAGSSMSGSIMFEYQAGLTGYVSARNMTSVRNPNGTPFDAAMLAQNTASAFFIDDLPDDFVFGAPASNGGNNLITGAPTLGRGWLDGNVYSVALYTADSSGWLPAGVDPAGDGNVLTALRMDVGGFAAGTQFINVGEPFNVLSVEVILFIDGGAVFSTASLAASNYASGLSGVSVIGGVAGSGVDEMQIRWTLDVPTPGTAALFGLAGVAAIRRRR